MREFNLKTATQSFTGIASSQELFSTRQVAAMFAVSSQTVDRWRKTGQLRYVVIGLGHPRFTRQTINEFIAANEAVRTGHQPVPSITTTKPEHML
jgi:excisionase family DNA binding protein